LGTQKRISTARAAAPPAPVHLFPLAGLGDTIAVVAGVVFTVKVPTLLAALELRVTVGFPTHVGWSFALTGYEVSAHQRAIAPAKPFVELKVTLDVANAPVERRDRRQSLVSVKI
jgi:hypothetical protein